MAQTENASSLEIANSPAGKTLVTIPPELRCHIYELAFTTEEALPDPVNLQQARPPSPALLLACRQMYGEAQGLYETASRRYWGTTNFQVVAKDSDSSLSPKQGFIGTQLGHIRHLTLVTNFGDLFASIIASMKPNDAAAEVILQRRADCVWVCARFDGRVLQPRESFSLQLDLEARSILRFTIGQSVEVGSAEAVTVEELKLLVEGF